MHSLLTLSTLLARSPPEVLPFFGLDRLVCFQFLGVVDFFRILNVLLFLFLSFYVLDGPIA